MVKDIIVTTKKNIKTIKLKTLKMCTKAQYPIIVFQKNE